MGIEGNSNNNEIQSQEINRANNEQIEQNNAEHKRSAEVLEANPTIDNEGERKQIDSKDDAADSTRQDEISKLDENDSIDENPETIAQDNVLDSMPMDSLDLVDSIEDSMDGYAEDTCEDVDALDDDIEITEPENYEDEVGDDASSEKPSLDDENQITNVTDEVSAADEGDRKNSLDDNDVIEETIAEAEDNTESENATETGEDETEGTTEDNTESENSDETSEDTVDEVEDTEDNAESENATETGEDTADEVETTEEAEDNTESENVAEIGEDTTDEVETMEEAEDNTESENATETGEDTADKVETAEEAEDNTEFENGDETGEDTADEVETTEEAEDNTESENATETGEDTADKVETAEEAEDNTEFENTAETSEDATERTTEEAEDNAESENVAETGEDATEEVEMTEDTEDNAESENTAETSEDATEGTTEEAEDNTESENASETSDDAEKADDKLKLEDLSWEQIETMMKTENGKNMLMQLNADFRERYEADMWGMTQEEYQDYKAACEKYQKEKEEQEKNGEEVAVEPSQAEHKAADALAKFEVQDEKSSSLYMSRGRADALKDMSDENGVVIAELKAAKNDVDKEKDAVYDQIASMHMRGANETNPGKYQELCAHYRNLESLSDRLNYAVVKMDMNNYDIAMATGQEYRDQGKKIDSREIEQTLGKADEVLHDGVSGEASIMDAFRLEQKIENDVLPSLDGSKREIETKLNVVATAQDTYLKEHNCTHEEAMTHSDGQYAQNESLKKQFEKEISGLDTQITSAVDKATALREQLPVQDSNCTIKVTDNHNGTITIERSWDNGGASTNKKDGGFHSSSTTLYKNATERRDSVTLGVTSGEMYSRQMSFQYRGIGYKREDQFGGENNRVKNVAEGGLLNANASVNYVRGRNGKLTTGSVNFVASLAQLKDTTSFIRNSKEYKIFSAEVSAMQGAVSTKVDSSGIVTAKASSHLAGGSASIGIGDLTIAKASGSVGAKSESFSSWDLFDKQEDKSKSADSTDEKKGPEVKASVSVGNNVTIGKVSTDGTEVKKTNVSLESFDSVGDIASVKKDIDTVKKAVEGQLGIDKTQKGETVISSKTHLGQDAHERSDTRVPADFVAKDINNKVDDAESRSSVKVSAELKTSLASFEQSKWDRMDLEQKKEAVSDLGDKIAEDLGLENKPEVKYYNNPDSTDFGGFSASENAIYLNQYNMADAKETADTIAHESRHCWQHEYAEKSDSPQAREFKENFDDYIRPEDDYRGYRNQPVEADARDYAKDINDNIPTERVSETNENLTEETNPNATDGDIRQKEEGKGAVFDGEFDLPADIESKSEDYESKVRRLEDYASKFEHDTQQKLEDYYKGDGGNLTSAQKEELVSDLKKSYDGADKSARGDVLVPESSKDVTNIYYNGRTGKYDVGYDWKPVDTVPESRKMEVLKEGQQFDRVGPPSGRCTGAVGEDGSCATVKERSIPYHFTEVDITKEPAYHRYEAEQDFTKENLSNAIDDSMYSNDKKAEMHANLDRYYENAQAKGYGYGDGLASGEIAPMFEDTTGATGGGKQYDMPFSMEELEDIGMISEVPKGTY